MDKSEVPNSIILKEAEFTAMNKKGKMFFYDKPDVDIGSELLTIFPTALIHSITDYEVLLTKKETRKFDKEFKIKTDNAQQYLTKKPE